MYNFPFVSDPLDFTAFQDRQCMGTSSKFLDGQASVGLKRDVGLSNAAWRSDVFTDLSN